ncbi:MAG: NUDIX domain-containing protein [Parachlamydiaceae bacterium]
MLDKHEISYGIIPLCLMEGEWHALLVQHASSKYWGFPKGHPETDEDPRTAAIRELKEETNLDVIRFFSTPPLEERYEFFHKSVKIKKKVVLFVAEVEGNLIHQEEEVSGAEWIPASKVCDKLTYSNSKETFQKALRAIK